MTTIKKPNDITSFWNYSMICAILNVLSSLDVVDFPGIEDAYMLANNNEDVRQQLAAVGWLPK
jgi:hypothetical protein